MYLDSTISLQADLDGAVAANEVHFQVWFSDQFPSRPEQASQGIGYTETTGGYKRTLSSGATDVVICSSPPAGTRRRIVKISCHNADTNTRTVRIFTDDASTEFTEFKAALATLESAYWTPGSEWVCLTVAGARK